MPNFHLRVVEANSNSHIIRNLSNSSLLEDLRIEIWNLSGIPSKYQKLSINEKELPNESQNNRTLEDVGIADGDVMQLLEKDPEARKLYLIMACEKKLTRAIRKLIEDGDNRLPMAILQSMLRSRGDTALEWLISVMEDGSSTEGYDWMKEEGGSKAELMCMSGSALNPTFTDRNSTSDEILIESGIYPHSLSFHKSEYLEEDNVQKKCNWGWGWRFYKHQDAEKK